MRTYRDKIAVVTGGASGIGRALVKALCGRGATVICADINTEAADRTVEEIVSAGGTARAVRLDVTRENQVMAVVRKTMRDYGRLDFMFNNAGIGIGGEVRDMDGGHWRRIMAVNLWGTIYGTLAAYSAMTRQGSGTIVNTASIAGLVPVPTLAAYAAGKHAIVGLSTSLRPEAADLGVQVNVVCPGAVRTPLFETAEMVGADTRALTDRFPFVIEPDVAASKILRGVEKNKAIIVFPLSNLVLWRFYRFLPWAVAPLSLKMAREFRKFRREDRTPR
jgi:NAD(P)-dependent dehydrogenase (short-subunit alcohol dehydrogenase family)